MITLFAKIAVKTIIIWTTVSTTSPVSTGPRDIVLAVYRPTMCNQQGVEYKVTTAEFEWNGKPVTVELSREDTGESMSQSVDCLHVGDWLR
jgi:hypothetical protein